MKRLAIIGSGRIGSALIRAILDGEAGDWELAAVLNRNGQPCHGFTTTTDAQQLFDSAPQLIIETAGVEGLQSYAERALELADLWTISGAALADPDLYQRLQQAGRAHGHRLRIIPGAISALDGIAALAVDEDAEVLISVDLEPSGNARQVEFSGSAREAARKYPEHVNVAIATAIAGPGIDRVQAEVVIPASGDTRGLGLQARSRYGELQLRCVPTIRPDLGINAVAASIIAALQQESQVIWAG